MVRYFCDRCKKEVASDDDMFKISITDDYRIFSVCSDCYDDFYDFMNNYKEDTNND